MPPSGFLYGTAVDEKATLTRKTCRKANRTFSSSYRPERAAPSLPSLSLNGPYPPVPVQDASRRFPAPFSFVLFCLHRPRRKIWDSWISGSVAKHTHNFHNVCGTCKREFPPRNLLCPTYESLNDSNVFNLRFLSSNVLILFLFLCSM